jgi:iron-sulfur cluster repair protein YtfE (RIC family)
MAFHADQKVEEIGKDPAALAVLKAMGINHCCGGHLRLTEAAAAAGVPVEALLDKLNAAVATA